MRLLTAFILFFAVTLVSETPSTIPDSCLEEDLDICTRTTRSTIVLNGVKETLYKTLTVVRVYDLTTTELMDTILDFDSWQSKGIDTKDFISENKGSLTMDNRPIYIQKLSYKSKIPFSWFPIQSLFKYSSVSPFEGATKSIKYNAFENKETKMTGIKFQEGYIHIKYDENEDTHYLFYDTEVVVDISILQDEIERRLENSIQDIFSGIFII